VGKVWDITWEIAPPRIRKSQQTMTISPRRLRWHPKDIFGGR